MKYRNMLPFVALSVLILTSCDDNKMEWYKDPTHGAVTSSELPLQLAEKISRYKPLKEYLSDPNFKLGIGVGMDEYLGDETTTTIVNENFNDLTIGYAMKHGPMVDSKGNLKFDKVDQLFTKTTEAGISIYGHCLIWHTNQNASYLKCSTNKIIHCDLHLLPLRRCLKSFRPTATCSIPVFIWIIIS